jgi:outer membrane immunogenic protein
LATPDFSPNERFGFKTNWLGTLTGLVGYAVKPQWMVYLDAGQAWARNQYTDKDTSNFFGGPFTGSSTANRSGWTIGTGLEYKFSRNWSVFGEYNFIQLRANNTLLSYVAGPGAVVPASYSYYFVQNQQTLLIGVNYRFGMQ